MKDCLRKGGLLLSVFLAAVSFTVISPFYPAVAIRQGIPSWLIGFVFSTFPIASMMVSFIIPKIMFRVGRTPVYISGLGFLALSNISISYLESSSVEVAIFLSFWSRMLSGIGAACENISVYAILTSDYPDEVSKMIPILEVMGGLGFTFGPFFGSVIFSLGGFSTSCFIVGITIAVFIPIIYKIIGPSHEYIISSDKIKLNQIWFKPVSHI